MYRKAVFIVGSIASIYCSGVLAQSDSDLLISEFQPNPVGADPANVGSDSFDVNPFMVTSGAINPSVADGAGPDGGPMFGFCGDQTESKIHAVQGNGASSPVVGTEVVIEGVVVGTFQSDANGNNGYRGYYVQEEDTDADADAATSEGLFVFDRSNINIVNVGEVVRVKGSVNEFFDLTAIENTSEHAVCSSGATATAAALTLPFDDITEFEAVEGMLVSFDQSLYVTDHFNLGRFGEVGLTSNADRLFAPTQITEPGLMAMAQQMENDMTRIVLDDGLTSAYPEPAPPYFAADGTLRAGDSVTGLTGILSYNFRDYRILPVQGVSFNRKNPREPTPASVPGSLTVAGFNVLNYFTTLNGSGSICGPAMNLSCRGARNSVEFTRQKDKIVSALLALDADIVGLMEIENDMNSATIADLAAALPGYSYIDTGPIGLDAIKVALIYKNSVTPKGDYAVLDSSVDPIFNDDKNRPVLIQSFEEVANGEVFTVAVNHYKSKGSSCDELGDPDLDDGQGDCNITRTNAATALINYLATDPTASGDTDFLIIGDLNAYAMEDPIKAIEAAGYSNLVLQNNGSEDYSYSFEGQFGTLDYAMSSASLTSQVGGVTVWKVNADEPDALDYSDFNQPSLYNSSPYRASDHDPVLVGLNLIGDGPEVPTCNGLPATIVADENGGRVYGTAGDDVIVGSSKRDVIYGRGGNDTICAEGGSDIVYAGNGADTVFGGRGRDRLYGGRGNDVLNGDQGRDRLYGNRGNDVLNGGAGYDWLYGGPGNDELNQGGPA